MNLQIRKKTAKVWAHVSDVFPVNILSSLYCKTDGDYFRYVELGGRQRARFHFSEITIYDDTSGGAPETFSSALSLMLRLENLEYPAFSQGSGGGGGSGFSPIIVNPQSGQVIQYIDGIWVNSSLDLNGDRFTVVQPIDVTGLDITLPIGFKWVINGVEYENTSAFLQTIALSSAGTERGDIFVANENNTFEYIQGVEDVANVVYPQAPPNKLFLTSIKVNDSSISTPTEPIIGNNYITKFSEKLNEINVIDGYIISIEEDRRTFCINNSDEDSSILGCERASGYNNTLWSGSDIWIWNNSENDVILKNDSENPNVEFKFMFSETGEDFVLKPNSKAHFKYNGFNDTFEFFGSSLDADNIDYDNAASGLLAETAQEAVDELSATKEDRVSVIPISTNTTISALHHGKILLITADVTITFPTGLGTGFTGCAFRIATGGKMTPAFGSGVTGDGFFANYNPTESLYVFKESPSTNVFYAV